ncbi:bifunctional pyr operon transcriptional regulator/uracil phosphoribosyltransferase PyrR [Neolewinella lacunae]|uniref:Bifunctional pyr operon transcriptional regulator/uracil phosphoribosyltransferase PyrR n=1 Tax=Neolewinella lacunae TaxID=1517758 RepID=A0A923PKD8_9BACT|nr:bifunctional pyr operon transcriptional regulator/uracil phosphoribosyltransferase PyrR [Neolewinella lacunae]MBC6992823.1 bifunctional pyr operon transcriptional regulator/uracil phosphoribosyltransferase PyrR [Neolewinella lacunae]MDN3636088.1 bifunctional pyr operon transcriptional regulator/uracil phosphoribosyltransferase PyrR [Neolewinella lacunae]
MPAPRIIHDRERFALTIERLCRHLIEEHGDFANTCLIGIQAGGVPLAERLRDRLATMGVSDFDFGKLDITFYRDDFRTARGPLTPLKTEIDFLVEEKRVVLVDDVLYSGRTTVSALTALNHFGRPAQVELLVMVDRRFRRTLPVRADYRGISVDTLHDEYVQVQWAQTDGTDQILLTGS